LARATVTGDAVERREPGGVSWDWTSGSDRAFPLRRGAALTRCNDPPLVIKGAVTDMGTTTPTPGNTSQAAAAPASSPLPQAAPAHPGEDGAATLAPGFTPAEASPRCGLLTRRRPCLTRVRSGEKRPERDCRGSLPAPGREGTSPCKTLPSVSRGEVTRMGGCAPAARSASSRIRLFRKRANDDEHGMHIVTSLPHGRAIRTAVIQRHLAHGSRRLLRLIVCTCPSTAAPTGRSCRSAIGKGGDSAAMRECMLTVHSSSVRRGKGRCDANVPSHPHGQQRPRLLRLRPSVRRHALAALQVLWRAERPLHLLHVAD
jgi:hypothetical protein